MNVLHSTTANVKSLYMRMDSNSTLIQPVARVYCLAQNSNKNEIDFLYQIGAVMPVMCTIKIVR